MNPLRKTALRGYMALSAPFRWYWGRVLAAANRYPVSILFYHRVHDRHPNPWTISTEGFQQQIDCLRKHFDIVSLAEAQNRIRTGNSRPTVSLTFDDGYADNSLTVIPYLVRNQIPATYFVNNENVLSGKPFRHDEERGVPLPPNGIESLKLMQRSGIEIGAHTRTHPDLGKTRDEEKIFDEVVVARDELEDLIGCRVRYFAFPFGQKENLNDEVFQLAKMYGFEGVCSAYGGVNAIGDDPFHLQRIHGDPEFLRFRNWLSLDPREMLKTSYPLPELIKSPETIQLHSGEEQDSMEQNSDHEVAGARDESCSF
ncbi:MAG: polysaccharide deacetylase family protein [Planctomycetota bacterium]|nr:polysaccharide deacetylase family protein [Planctomycetota bacterium]